MCLFYFAKITMLWLNIFVINSKNNLLYPSLMCIIIIIILNYIVSIQFLFALYTKGLI